VTEYTLLSNQHVLLVHSSDTCINSKTASVSVWRGGGAVVTVVSVASVYMQPGIAPYNSVSGRSGLTVIPCVLDFI
jgi:hypothetical protein